jgi:dTMP kinase
MFITIEGPDGSGKTTHITMLEPFLRSRGYSIVITREPGGTFIGDLIRNALLRPKKDGLNPRTESLLFQASRAQLVEDIIRPAILAGCVVICDRYTDSTLAYQGYGDGIDLGELRHLIHFATLDLVPDLTLLLDVDVEIGLQRKKNSSDQNLIDNRPLEYHRRVQAGYLELLKQEPHRWIVVDANRDWDDVQEQLRSIILKKLDGIGSK